MALTLPSAARRFLPPTGWQLALLMARTLVSEGHFLKDLSQSEFAAPAGRDHFFPEHGYTPSVQATVVWVGAMEEIFRRAGRYCVHHRQLQHPGVCHPVDAFF